MTRALGAVLFGVFGCIGWILAEPDDTIAANPLLDTKPVRDVSGLILKKETWSYDCMECHRSIKAKWQSDHLLTEHRELKLNHGNNRFCLNCHHPTNRNAFVDYDGSEIQRTDVVGLCGKCHGPQKRDWAAGVHGRVNGFWNVQTGAKQKLICIECHNPHDPAFKAMKPLAPPTYPQRAAGKIKYHGKEKQ